MDRARFRVVQGTPPALPCLRHIHRQGGKRASRQRGELAWPQWECALRRGLALVGLLAFAVLVSCAAGHAADKPVKAAQGADQGPAANADSKADKNTEQNGEKNGEKETDNGAEKKPAPAPPREPVKNEPVKNEALRAELLKRRDTDQKFRMAMAKEMANPGAADAQEVDSDALVKEMELDPAAAARLQSMFAKNGKPKLTPAAVAAMKEGMKIDRANTARMKEIIAEFGWPGKSLVGGDASIAAWLLVQHADLDVPFQKQCLALMEQAVKDKEARAADFAYLTDRVLVADNQKQRYGSQLLPVNGKLTPQPIEDEEHVDKRRKEIGLEPLAEYVKTAEKFYRSPPEPPQPKP